MVVETHTTYNNEVKQGDDVEIVLTFFDHDKKRLHFRLEMYEKKDIEVLILDDEIDEIVISSVPKYDEKELKSVNRSGAADDFSEDKNKDKEESLKPVLKKIKKIFLV